MEEEKKSVKKPAKKEVKKHPIKLKADAVNHDVPTSPSLPHRKNQ